MAETYLAVRRVCGGACVPDVYHCGDVQGVFGAATGPKAGRYKIALEMT
ncbi:hypothetical protein GCM10010399_52520 [Dactylosporangium fulvum]|uniref:Uncharacterized protein n=1 Tax=Dactylosporangium fulvum TaxID=53359 RepID=A0ABY5W8F3_9ACTN|nr:hypothetical protein [Dactylosporangium fulvum]UWP86377.1 hypothetical protein Dfulv_19905 [Dactylosporangium fulvum]